MKKYFTILILLTLVSLLFAGGTFMESSAQPRANKVIISWITNDESGLKNFIVQRSTDEVTFIDLKSVNLSGPGYNYTYSDNDVLFKTNGTVWYKIIAVKKNAPFFEESEVMIVHPTTTGIIKKSWGAIKAMFR